MRCHQLKNDLKIEGFDELEKELKKLAEKVNYNESEQIVYQAAETIITPTIQSNAPVGPSGNLKDAIVTKKMPRSTTPVAISAIDRKKAPHAHLVENGSGPRYDDDGRYLGEMPPNPFFRKSVDQSMSSAYKYIEDELKKRVSK